MVNVERAILRVVHPQFLWERVGGMLVLERQLFTAARAGLKSVWVKTPEPAGRAGWRVPLDLEVRWISAGECEPPYLEISGDHFLRVDTLAFIARRRFPTSIRYEDGSGRSVIWVVLTHEDTLDGGPDVGRSDARNLGRVLKRPLPDDSYKRLDAPLNSGSGSAGLIVDWLMLAGPKPQDGFMARHFDRRLSLAASRTLLDSSVTPNQMTVLATALGLIGGAFFLGATHLFYVAGALLVWLHSVLDGCDGELARVRFQESSFGSDLDFWSDNLVHLALFSCIGLGFWRAGNGLHNLALAAVADAGVIASAWTMWRGRPAVGVLESQLGRLENALAQRDFISLLVLLAFLDCVYEFLWAAAVGGSLYFAIMLYLRRVNDNAQTRQPHPAR